MDNPTSIPADEPVRTGPEFAHAFNARGYSLPPVKLSESTCYPVRWRKEIAQYVYQLAQDLSKREQRPRVLSEACELRYYPQIGWFVGCYIFYGGGVAHFVVDESVAREFLELNRYDASCMDVARLHTQVPGPAPDWINISQTKLGELLNYKGKRTRLVEDLLASGIVSRYEWRNRKLFVTMSDLKEHERIKTAAATKPRRKAKS